jgi:hypothetical protein
VVKLTKIASAVIANAAWILVASFCGAAPSWAQSVLIDDFTTGPATVGNSSDTFQAAAGDQTGSMLGGNRFEQIECFSGCDTQSTMTIGSGALNVSVPSGPSGGLNTAQIIWGQSLGDPSNPLNVDLSAEGGLQLTFSNVTSPLDVNAYISSSDGFSTYSTSSAARLSGSTGVVIPAGTSETLYLPFADFFGVASLTNLNSIEFIFGGSNFNNGDGVASASYSLTSVEAVQPVPLPAAAWLLLSGLVGVGALGFASKRNREGFAI